MRCQCASPVFLPRPGRRQTPASQDKCRRLPVVRAPYFHPARDGGRPQDQDGKTNGEARRRSRCKVTPRNAQQPPNRTGLQHEGPRGAEPTAQGQSSGAEGQARATRREAEDEQKPRVAHDTIGEEQPTVTHLMPVPPTEKQVNTLAFIPPAPYIRTVSKGDVNNLHGEPKQEKGDFSNPGTSGRRLPLPCKPNARQLRICTPPGTAAPTNMARKPESPVFVPRPGRRQQPNMATKQMEPRTSTPPGTAANQHKPNNTNSNG